MHTQTNILRRTLMCVATLTLTCWAAVATAQDAKDAALLTLSLEPAKSRLVLGEPVYVTARLRNSSANSAQVQTMLEPSAGLLTVLVQGSNVNEPIPFIPLSIGDFELPTTTLARGENMESVFQVFFGGRGWTFPAPGTYQLTAVLEGTHGSALRSRPVEITVSRGDGAGAYLFDQSTADQLETGKFLVWQQGDHLRRAQATVEEIVKQFPESPVSDYGRLAMGLNLSRPFHDYSIGRIRPARPDTALQLLDDVRPDILPNMLRMRLGLGLTRAYSATGRHAAADRAFANVRSIAAAERLALEPQLQSELTSDPALQKYRLSK